MAAVHCEDALNELEHYQFLLALFFEIVESLHSNSRIQPYSFDDLVMLIDIYQCHNQEAISNLKLALQDLRGHLNH
jgi:hypothetical protein